MPQVSFWYHVPCIWRTHVSLLLWVLLIFLHLRLSFFHLHDTSFLSTLKCVISLPLVPWHSNWCPPGNEPLFSGCFQGIFSLSLFLSSVTVMCLDMGLLGLSCLGSVELLESVDPSIATLVKFSVIFQHCPLSASRLAPWWHSAGLLPLSPRLPLVLSLSTFFSIFFSLCHSD